MATLETLMSKHRFTAEHLAANRAGRLHPEQQQKGTQAGQGGAIFLFVLTVLFLGGGFGGAFVFRSTLHEPVSRVDQNGVYAIAAGGSLLALGALALGIGSWRGTLRRRAEFAQGKVEAVELTFQMDPLKQQFADSFLVAAGPHRLFLARDLGRALVPGTRYRLYLLDGVLLSLEPLS